MSKEIEKKQILPDSKMPVAKGTLNDQGKKIRPIKSKVYDAQADLKKYGLKPTELLEYTDPITKEKKSIMIDRRGTTDEKLALALLDDTISREQKDSMISMFLFEKGKEGASMLMDLWSYKGQHTKESRAFNSQMRYDYEMFLHVFQMFMRDSHDLLWEMLPLAVDVVEVDGKKKEIVKLTSTPNLNDVVLALGQYARFHNMSADLLGERVKAETAKREAAKGKGIYIDLNNKPYSVTEDGDIVEVVAKDKASMDAQKNGTN